MIATLTRCEVAVLVDGPEAAAAVVSELGRALQTAQAADVWHQLPGRLYAHPAKGTVAQLAERVGAWLRKRGIEVKIGDW